jgi:uncharacterized protein with PIN domain
MLNDKLKQSRADDVTMDCTKCKAHIKAETLKEVEEKIKASYPECYKAMLIWEKCHE